MSFATMTAAQIRASYAMDALTADELLAKGRQPPPAGQQQHAQPSEQSCPNMPPTTDPGTTNNAVQIGGGR